MAYTYDLKVVVSGKQVELYKYKKTVWREYKTYNEEAFEKKPKQLDIFEQEKLKKQRMQFSMNRTKTEIRRLANSNPQLNKFLTLTFAKSTTDIKTANYIFNQFIKRIVYRYPDFKYLAVPEFQQDTDHYGRKKEHGGSVHYHLLCNIKMPKTNNLKELFDWEKWFALRYWKYGFIKIKDVKQITNMGAYFCKYLGKDMFDKRMFRKKKFFCSQKLNKPVEMTGYEATSFYDHYISGLTPIFVKTFFSEYAGTIDYSAFTLPEDIHVNLNIDNQEYDQGKAYFGISEII